MTNIDLLKKFWARGPRVPLVDEPHQKTESGTGDAVVGFAGVARVYAQIQIARVSGEETSVTVAIEESTDGDSWSACSLFDADDNTVESLEFSERGSALVMILSPQNQLRATWEVTGSQPKATVTVSATPDYHAPGWPD